MGESARFFKGHGLGNDYLAMDYIAPALELTPPRVRIICDRNYGVGSDGILARVTSERADFGLRIFNPDGSEAEKSGNGLRIFAAYLDDAGLLGGRERFTVETRGGLVGIRMLRHDGALDVEVDMGQASFSSAEVGLLGPDREVAGETLELAGEQRVSINTVSMGNPHCVVLRERLDPSEFRRLAPGVSTHPSFTRGTNVQFARVAGPSALEAMVWERGAGETLSSGSSACAVATVAVRRGLVAGGAVEVRMPGGLLFVDVAKDWSVRLRGPVEGVYRGEFTGQLMRRLQQAAEPR